MKTLLVTEPSIKYQSLKDEQKLLGLYNYSEACVDCTLEDQIKKKKLIIGHYGYYKVSS